MGLATVRQLVESRLSANWTSTDIKYENVPYEPTAGTSFISVHTLPGAGSQKSMGATTAMNRWPGIIDIGVFIPLNKGTDAGFDIVDDLIDLFYHYEASGLVCETAYATTLGQSDEWYRYSVTVPFYYDDYK